MKTRVIRLPEVLDKTGYSKSTVFRKSADQKDDFPLARQIGLRAIGWIEEEIDDWIETRARVGATSQGETDDKVAEGAV